MSRVGGGGGGGWSPRIFQMSGPFQACKNKTSNIQAKPLDFGQALDP